MSNYILGTGLSHDGSTCILKDGEIIVAIEKERLSRIKHDGGNDYLSVKYCLDAAGIGANDLSLIVQASNFEIDIKTDRYSGKRYFAEDIKVPVVTISHHLAHAWSAAGSSPFNECNVMVIDGAGSPYHQCVDIGEATIPDYPFEKGLYCEKDSFYHFDGTRLKALYKDFSEVKLFDNNPVLKLPTNYHSIGGLYSAVSFYCFGNMDDAGKLMGLAPYGKLDGKPSLFKLDDGRIEVNYENLNEYFYRPSTGYDQFKKNFVHYADIARWMQDEAEKAILYLFQERMKLHPHQNMSYAGGVALNAVANKKLLQNTDVQNLYMQPAAGDNGLAIGCAWYGWFEVQGNTKKMASPASFFGKAYTNAEIRNAIASFQRSKAIQLNVSFSKNILNETADLLAEGKVVGWYQEGAEFGPRALGHRSILAHPGKKEIRDHINRNIKFREDFRPFAPAVRLEMASTYFKYGWYSPYMILVDEIKPEWRHIMPAIVHEDGTCRVQTVTSDWNSDFYQLLKAFEEKTGIGVLLNTSLNRKGMPIVETPLQALELFYSGALDVLVLNDCLLIK